MTIRPYIFVLLLLNFSETFCAIHSKSPLRISSIFQTDCQLWHRLYKMSAWAHYKSGAKTVPTPTGITKSSPVPAMTVTVWPSATENAAATVNPRIPLILWCTHSILGRKVTTPITSLSEVEWGWKLTVVLFFSENNLKKHTSVSYTHLTLPTKA